MSQKNGLENALAQGSVHMLAIIMIENVVTSSHIDIQLQHFIATLTCVKLDCLNLLLSSRSHSALAYASSLFLIKWVLFSKQIMSYLKIAALFYLFLFCLGQNSAYSKYSGYVSPVKSQYKGCGTHRLRISMRMMVGKEVFRSLF